MITLHTIDLSPRVIYERREREEEKKIHIVPSVSIQFYIQGHRTCEN
jgi:hypothetical protein